MTDYGMFTVEGPPYDGLPMTVWENGEQVAVVYLMVAVPLPQPEVHPFRCCCS